MKSLFILFLMIYSAGGYAQTLAGIWRGSLVSTQNQTVSIPTTLALSSTGNQLTGSLMLQNNGVNEKYSLAGTVQGEQAAGTVTYSVDNSVFEFELVRQNGQVEIAIGLVGTPVLYGKFERAATSPGRTAALEQRATTPANLKALGVAGQWEQAFRGRRLIYLKTGNGLNQKWYFDLCSNGAYAYYNDSFYRSGDFSQRLDSNEQGTWHVVMRGDVAHLVFSPQNKPPYEKTIQPLRQGEVALQGARYFLDTNRSCQ